MVDYIFVSGWILCIVGDEFYLFIFILLERVLFLGGGGLKRV